MKNLLISSVAMALALGAVPASAQLLGGSGGGMLGGGLGGTVSRGTGIGSAAGGTLSGAGSISGDQTIDRRSGRVGASRSASGSASGTLDSATRLPTRSITGSASGTASGNASGSADAQLIGTDAVRGVTLRATSRTRDALGTARDRTGNLVQGVANGTGSAQGDASARGAASFSGSLGQLALAGTGAASGAGSFDVVPGMAVVNKAGRTIGTVRSVATNARGTIRSVVVAVGDRTATLPAANFTGEGSVLVSAMGKGDMKDVAKDQSDTRADNTKR